MNLSNKTDSLSKVRMNEKDEDEDKLIKQVLDNLTPLEEWELGACVRNMQCHINGEWLRACLDSTKTEWYHLVFMIHHPKRVAPTEDKVFDLVLDDCFNHSKTQNFEFGWWKLKTQFWHFHI